MTSRLLALSLLLFAVACAESPAPGDAPSSEGGPLTVVATTGMIADVAQRVVGDATDVVSLCGPGVDPHTYKATRRDVDSLRSADVVLYNGLGLEARMTDVLVRLATEGRRVVAVTSQLGEDFMLTPEEFEGHEDPHVWNDPNAWLSALDVITETLVAAAPAQAAAFEANADAFRAEVEEMAAYARECYASIPAGQRVLITSHDAFNYLGRAFDIEVVGVQGVTTESEAGLADVQRIVDLIVEREIAAIFTENISTGDSIRAIVEGCAARGWTVEVGGEVFSDAFGAPGTYEGTYLGMVDHNATLITRGLGGEAPVGGRLGKLRPE